MAAKYLERVTANQRSTSKVAVGRMARAMSRGEWRLTHQGIAFDVEGLLVDGAHRLNAIIESGVTVEMVVWEGVDPRIFDLIDVGRRRSPGDIVTIAGYKNAKSVAAGARLLLAYRRIPDKTWNGPPINDFTAEELLAEIATHPTIEERAADAVNLRHNVRIPTAASTAALTLFFEVDPEKRVYGEFLDRLSMGANLTIGDPLLLCRNWFVNKTLPTQTNRQHSFVILVKAWNAYVTGARPGRLQWRGTSEGVPSVYHVDPDRYEAQVG
jgi:hypothetical protein